MEQKEDHPAEAQEGARQGHDRPAQGFGFDDVRLSAAVTIARVLQNSLFVPFPFTASAEDETTQKKHRYRPNLLHR